jgi:PAS domain S-box-containing protein
MVRRDARILVGSDSTILEATDAALDLLGLTIDELRALPPGALSMEEDREASAGFSEAWEQGGRGAVVGSGTMRRLDGRLVRLRYHIAPLADETFDIIIEESLESVTEPARTYTLNTALSAWRAAERKLASVDPQSPEGVRAQAEFDYFRMEYQRLAHPPTERAGRSTEFED